jgi:two-component system phosphate regulon sensor histidine kinase PhoR
MDALLTGMACTGLVTLAWLWWRQRTRAVDLAQALARQQAGSRRLEAEQQQALAGAQAQLQTLFNSMGEGMLLLGQDGRIQLANRALEQLLGLTRDLRGRTLLEAFRWPRLQDLAAEVRAQGRVAGVELEWSGPEPRWMQVNAAVIESGAGGLQGMILVFHDLTRLKQLENTRQEFVANVSHELRTPLSMIKGYVETLLDGAQNDPALAARFLTIIQKHTDRLTYLIDDLLTLSHLESGRLALNLGEVALREQAGRVLEELAVRAADKQLTLCNELPTELRAYADAERLHQVLFNLVDNAIRHGRSGGRVTLSGASRDDRNVEVRVADDGPGIPAEAVGRLFERFYRVDRARSREQGGTGLGLAIVKHLVLAQGGQVGVQSTPGHGATFHFTLPVFPLPPAAL